MTMVYEHPVIEDLFQPYKSLIGKDYEKYRNHVYRVFLNCIYIDRSAENENKYAIAAVFHDIGIWTDGTIDYLKPSIAKAQKYLGSAGLQDWEDEIESMIYWHHKPGKYTGDWQLTTETFRKADWIDVTLGFLSFGLKGSLLRKSRSDFPNSGFHFFLLKKIANNFLRHPLNPLPMFKK